MNESNLHNPGDLWRNQPTHGVTVPVEEIRRRVKRSEARQRHRQMIGAAAIVVNLGAAFVAFALPELHPLHSWLVAVQMIALTVWFTYLRPQRRYRNLRRDALLGLNLSSASNPCLDFYKEELESRREGFRNKLKMIPWMSIFLLPLIARGYQPQVLILLGLLLTFFVTTYVAMKRELPRLQAELDELAAFRRQA
jgi:hypothetical protein